MKKLLLLPLLVRQGKVSSKRLSDWHNTQSATGWAVFQTKAGSTNSLCSFSFLLCPYFILFLEVSSTYLYTIIILLPFISFILLSIFSTHSLVSAKNVLFLIFYNLSKFWSLMKPYLGKSTFFLILYVISSKLCCVYVWLPYSFLLLSPSLSLSFFLPLFFFSSLFCVFFSLE
jgi:hypothetical protein